MKPTLILTSIFLLAALFVAANNSPKEAVVENPDSLAEAGIRYLRNETPDYEKAFLCLRHSVDAGSTKGLGHLSRCYALGYGVEKNTDSAMFYCKKAAVAGDNRAQYTLGRLFYTKTKCAVNDSTQHEKYRKAAYYWMKAAADNGNGPAIFVFGKSAYKGEVLFDEPDYGIAFSYLSRYIELLRGRYFHFGILKTNRKEAYIMLADLYATGRGVEADKDMAQKLIEEEMNTPEKILAEQQAGFNKIHEHLKSQRDSLQRLMATPPIRFAPVRPIKPYVPKHRFPKIPFLRRLPL